MTELIEAWQIHKRINLFLLEASKGNLTDVSVSTVGAQFAHIHGVHVAWLEQSKLDLPAKVSKVDYLNSEVLKTPYAFHDWAKQ